MLLGFKRQFEQFVIDGTKTHTIRGMRAILPAPGEICHCYVDPRQKTMRLLGRWPCIKVDGIKIQAAVHRTAPLRVSINGDLLQHDEAVMFMWRDGFRAEDGRTSLMQAAEFWDKRLRENSGTWMGILIHWKYDYPGERRG